MAKGASKKFGISGGGKIPKGKKIAGPGQQLKQIVGGKGVAKF